MSQTTPALHEFAERLASGTRREGGCRVWTGERGAEGHGRVKVRGVRRGAHRVSWEYSFGEIPSGMQVLHRCDNPPCVDPSHLFVGTIADNMRDRHAKGRDARGERHGMCKYSDVTIWWLRFARAMTGASTHALARHFGMSQPHAAKILRGEARATRVNA